MAQYTLLKFDSEQQFLAHAVHEFKSLAEDAITKRGKFCVGLSGGTTPKILFEALSKAEIDWSKIHLYWSDERYVSHSDPESNYGMAHKHLLSHINIPAVNIHGIPTELADPHEAAKKYEETLKKITEETSSPFMANGKGVPFTIFYTRRLFCFFKNKQ